MPTSCGGLARRPRQPSTPGRTRATSSPTAPRSPTSTATRPAVTGCNALAASPRPCRRDRPPTSPTRRPASTVDLHIPQTNSLNQLATAHLRKAVVTLPEGLVINPSGANGLDGCTSAQVGIDPDTGVANGDAADLPRRLQDRHGRGRHPAARRPAAGLRLRRHAPRQPLRLPAGDLRRRRRPDDRRDRQARRPRRRRSQHRAADHHLRQQPPAAVHRLQAELLRRRRRRRCAPRRPAATTRPPRS